MTKVVYRDRLELHQGVQSRLLGGGKVIHVAEDALGPGVLHIWFEGDEGWHGRTQVFTDFLVVQTGLPFPDGYEHVETVTISDGRVFHVYKSDVKPAR